MKLIICIVFLIFVSCKQENPKEIKNEAQKEVKKDELVFLTTEEFPWQMEKDPNGEKGATYEILREVLKTYGDKAPKVRFVPWARAYKKVSKGEKNLAIFTILRRADREDSFDWCCYLFETRGHQPFILKDSHLRGKLNKKEDLAGKSIVVWRGDASDFMAEKLKNSGIVPSNITRVESVPQQIKMLQKRRADVGLLPEAGFRKFCENEGLDCSNLYVPFVLPNEDSELYIALSKNTSKNIRDEFVARFEAFSKTEDYQKIVKKYGLIYIKR